MHAILRGVRGVQRRIRSVVPGRAVSCQRGAVAGRDLSAVGPASYGEAYEV